jgi:cell wall-associated NlpC family hydrolase
MLFPGILPEMLQADFWIKRLVDPEKTIMNAAEIAVYNQHISAALPNTVYDLPSFPTRLTKATLKGWLTAAVFPTKPLYLNGERLTSAYYESLQFSLNLKALAAQNQVRYGFTIARTNLRTFPITDLVLEEPDHPEYDFFQGTGLNPAEPVVILHQTSTADWYFIQSTNYRGWTPAATIAAASHRQWLDYLQSKEFLVVTGTNLTYPGREGTPSYYFEMGAKLPLATELRQSNSVYTAILPATNRQTRLQFCRVPLPVTTEIQQGYLNYTQANLLRQAFKMTGQTYDWGGMQGGVDCSSLILNLFRCFGFTLPRNVAEQEQLPGKRADLTTLSIDEKKAALSNLPPGTTLYMKGHVMIYLGTINDTPYIFQALSSHGVPDGLRNIKKTYPRQVTVTDLSLLRANGHSFLESLTTAINIQS